MVQAGKRRFSGVTDEKQKGGASRRDLLDGAAVGIAAVSAMARPAMAQEQKSPGAPMSERAAGFATPPFPKQKQPWPGHRRHRRYADRSAAQ